MSLSVSQVGHKKTYGESGEFSQPSLFNLLYTPKYVDKALV